jgi:LDH2 family malate/lactate/ureidoglycolate dehydrogenase
MPRKIGQVHSPAPALKESSQMAPTNAEPARVPAAALSAFIARAFRAAGLPEDDARTLGDLIAEADLRGSDTHGVFRMPAYCRRIKAGGVKARPNIRIVEERASTALVDGDNAMGHLVMKFAAETAIAKAKRNGIGWVGARMSNHAGPAALYAMMPLAHDMIGLYFAVGSNNHLPPWGGLESLLGTNPIAVAVPAQDEPPVVMDMAPTVTAYGKVRLKASRGEEMPVGWMIDKAGKPLTDPKRADEGHLLPIGDYKGYALSLIIALLAGSLNRAAVGHDIFDFNKELGRATNTGQSIVALSVEAFAPVAEFKRSVDTMVRTLRQSERLPGVERIWLPGEQSHEKRLDRMKNGIPLPPSLKKSLDELAKELGVEPLL